MRGTKPVSSLKLLKQGPLIISFCRGVWCPYCNLELQAFNGDRSWARPMPARYVVGQEGTILYAEVNPDYTCRPEPEDMLPVLRRQAGTARKSA